MRSLTFAYCTGLLLALKVAAQPLRIVTWQPGDSFASAGSAAGDSVATARLNSMAAVLKAYDPDVIVLEGVNDRNACQRLAGLMKPTAFQFAQLAALRGASNAPVTRPAAVLARRVAGAARSLDWKSTGQIDSTGG